MSVKFLNVIKGLNINKSINIGILKNLLKPNFEVTPLTVKVIKLTKKENKYSVYVSDTVTEVKMFLSPSISHLIEYLYSGRIITIDNYMTTDNQIAENKFVKIIVITSIDKIDYNNNIVKDQPKKYRKIEIQFTENVHPDILGPVYNESDKIILKSSNPVK